MSNIAIQLVQATTRTTSTSSAAAVWSAVAASFAALSSIMIFWIQHQNLKESIRPEIILARWTRQNRDIGGMPVEILSFQTIINVGRGPAHNVVVWHSDFDGNEARAILERIWLPILAVNKEEDVHARINIFWNRVELRPEIGFRFLPINLLVYCSDSRGLQYETTYALTVYESAARVRNIGGGVLCEGVTLGTRYTVSKAYMPHRIKHRIRSFFASVIEKAKAGYRRLQRGRSGT